MIVFILIVGLVLFLLLLAYFHQRDQRKYMEDDENYVEPKIENYEE